MRVTGRTQLARWGGALLVALAPLPWLGLGTAAATGEVFATVTGHQAFSSEADAPGYWGSDCTSISGGSGNTYVLAADSSQVVVQSGTGQFANTIFKDASSGETVWADTNGDGAFYPGGKAGDQPIGQIISCVAKVTTTASSTETTKKPRPSNSETSESASPTDTETTGSASPTDTETTGSASPTDTETSESPSPTDTETTGSATPSHTKTTPIETGSSQPGKSPSASVKATRLTQPAVLPQTGSDVPVGGALAASLLLIGLGALLILGPGRLAGERYSRKH